MKKFIFILLAFVAFATVSEAQVVDAGAADTLTNADTGTFEKKTNQDAYLCYSIQPVINRLSGTLAGTIVLYGSNNDTVYVSTGDTITLTNTATFSTMIYPVDKQFKYYQVRFVTSGTVSARCRVLFYYKNN